MSLCHECGEKVANIDIYCPFCGISLKPFEADSAADDSLASTIYVNGPKSAKISGSDSPVENGAAIAAAVAAPLEAPADGEPAESAAVEEQPAEMTLPDEPAEPAESAAVEEQPAEMTLPDEPAEPAESAAVEEQPAEMTLPDEPAEPAESFAVEEQPAEMTLPDEPAEPAEPAAVEEQPAEMTLPIESGPKTIADALRETIEEEPDVVTEPDIAGLNTTAAEPAAAVDVPDVISAGGPIAEDAGAEVGLEFGGVGEAPTLAYVLAAPSEEVSTSATEGSDNAAVDDNAPALQFVNAGREVSGPRADAAPGQEPTGEPEPERATMTPGGSAIDAEENVEELTAGDRVSAVPGEPADIPSDLALPFADESGKSAVSAATEAISAESAGSDDGGFSIAKPEIELESKDSQSGASEFDSVKIIESPSEIIEEARAGDEPHFETVDDEVVRESGSGAEPAAEIGESGDEGRPSRSYTTPNIGVGDTDGKQSKLKPLSEGTVLNGRYEIVRKIGGGGMGAVYLASDKNLGGVLRAVKEMVQSYIEEEQQEKAINDFKRESLLLTTLEHPAIPTIYDYFYDEKEARFYLVMKYINGGDLASRLRAAPEGRIDEKSVVEWAIQMADVLDYLHQRQPPIVYRDLKPANIMMDGNTGRVMLIDFGIARWINKEEKGVTAVGTMGYAPPELFSGKVEPRSDIYSLGSTMFHLMTGSDPQSNPLLIFDFQKHPRPRQINAQLSDQIEAILMQAVEYNASKRIASAAELRKQLEEHLQNLQAHRVTFGVKEAPTIIGLADENVFCGFCGQNIVASDMFCAFCGAKQPIAQKGVHREIYATPRLTASLMVIGTNDAESPVFAIEKDDNLVGRRDPMSNIFPEVDLSKFDPQTKISRRHARVWREGGNFMVEDLGSSNGTILLPSATESIRLTPNQPHVLTSGDKLKLGDTTLHFVLG